MDTLEDLIRDSMRRHESDAPNPSGLLAGVASRERGRRRRLQSAAAGGTVAVVAGVVVAASLIGGGQPSTAPPGGSAGATTGLPGSDVVTDLAAPVTTTRTGSAVVTLGVAPPGANHLQIKLICLTSGTFTVADGASMTCSGADAAAGTGVMTYALTIKPGQKTTTIRTSAASRWRLTTTYASVTTSAWGVNKAGQTFGVTNAHGTPTLVAAIASNGKEGYVYDRDLQQPAPANPSQALAEQNAPPTQVKLPVYASDGTTVIGTLLTQTHSSSDVTTRAASSATPAATVGASPSAEVRTGGASASASATSAAPAAAALRAAPYFYYREIDTDAKGQTTSQIWMGHTSPGRLVAGTVWGTSPPYNAYTAHNGSGPGLSWEQLSTVTDPETIRKAVLKPVPGTDDNGSPKSALRFAPLPGPASPAFVAALFDVLRDLPGVKETADVTDAGGRTGVALQQQGYRYIFTPDHTRLLERDQLPKRDCATDSTWNSQLFLESGPVSSTTETVPDETLPHQPPADLCPSP